MIQTNCPQCATTYRLPDTQGGKKVRCKECQATFLVPEEVPVLEEADEPAASRRGGRRRDEAEELPVLDEEPRERIRTDSPPPRVRSRDDDEDDRPVRRRSRDEDDYDDEPRSGGGGGAMLIVGIAVGVLVLLGGGGGLAWYLASSGGAAPPPDQGQGGQNPPPPVVNPGGAFGGPGAMVGGGPDPFNAAGGAPPVVPPPEMRPEIRTVDDAINVLKTKTEPHDLMPAFNFLTSSPAQPGKTDEVGRALRTHLQNDRVKGNAHPVLVKYPSKEALDDLIAMADGNGFEADGAADTLARAFPKEQKAAEFFARLFPVFARGSKAAAFFRKMGKPAEKYVLPYLHHPNFSTRREAEALIGEFGTSDADVSAQAIKDLSADDREKKKAAVITLTKRKPDPEKKEQVEQASRLLEAMLSDRNPFERREVIDAMANGWATKENADKIVEQFEQPLADKPKLIGILAKMKAKSTAIPLATLFVKSPAGRAAIKKALIGFGPDAEQAAIAMLKTPELTTARAGIEILGEVGGADAVKELTAARKLKTAGARAVADDIDAALKKIKERMK